MSNPCTVPDCGAKERQQLSPSDGWVRAEISGFMEPRWFHNAACAATALQAAEKGLYFHARAQIIGNPFDGKWVVMVLDPATTKNALSATDADILAVTDAGPASQEFPAASAGHRLVELGYIVISAERDRPETSFGWTQANEDVWTTVCTTTGE